MIFLSEPLRARPVGREQPLGPQAHDGVRALLQVACSHIDVDDSNVHVLAGGAPAWGKAGYTLSQGE